VQATQKNEIKPWQVKTWCIGTPSARFVAKMEDVLDVYARPYDPKRPVVCVDEGAKELRSTPRGTLPPEPATPVRQDYEYERHGKVNLFVAVEPLSGWRSVRVTERHTSLDFAEELRLLVDLAYPEAEQVVLVTDNLNIHSPACLYEAFPPSEARRLASKIEWHYTGTTRRSTALGSTSPRSSYRCCTASAWIAVWQMLPRSSVRPRPGQTSAMQRTRR
jgi:hypothetical protein